MTETVRRINENTAVTLSLKVAVPMMLTVLAGVWMTAVRLQRIETKLDAIDAMVLRDEMKAWAREFKAENGASVKVPEIPTFAARPGGVK